VLDQLFSLIYLLSWIGGIALLAWWLWSLRRARTAPPPAPRPEDQAEIARLRAHLGVDGSENTVPAPDSGPAGAAPR